MAAPAHASIYSEKDQQLWRDCTKWLAEWGMFKSDDKFNSSYTGAIDLANALRDGVIICELLNKIYPGCIDLDQVSQKPTVAQFLCVKNINLFLKCCREKFELKESDLFEDHMLSDLTNFHQVLCTLSKISTCRKALRTSISGFFVPEHLSDAEEHIYESLHYYEIAPRESSLANSTHEYMLPEETFMKICPVSQNDELKAASVLEKRYYAIKELIDTEKKYVDVLSATVEKFMANLRQYMTPQDINITFFKIKNLFDLHLEFLCELLKINNTNPFIKISNVFLNWSHKFLIYGPYCVNITKAQRKIEELCKNDEIFLQVLTKCEMEYKRLHLVDILKFPMNRFLQYRLLLERIIAYTPRDHEEHKDLHKAMEAMLQLNDYINEMKGDSDRLEEAEQLQGVIREWNYDPTLCKLNTLGRLIKDDLVKIRSRDDEVLRNRNIFILDRFILICKRLNQFGPNQFAYRSMINIAEYFIRDDGLTNQFYLEKKDHQMRYTIYARSTELKEQIIRAITEARAYIHIQAFQHLNHHYQLTTFNSPERCASCLKYLSGKIYQGYKCDVCNLVVHKNCISSSENCGLPTEVKEKLWYVGEMDRKTATEKLSCRESGTFLIRIRPENDGLNVYSLTLKNGNNVHYFKIICINEIPRKYYLVENNIFQNLIQLVHHYQSYSLGAHFKEVPDDAKLLWPYRQLRAIVIKNYVASDILELSLLEGQSIKIVATDGYCKGFWKGRTKSDEIGYFPMDVVKVEGEVNFGQMEDGYCI